jgi:cyclopropane-fatty-acyl-phospholipid synthase
MSFAINCAEKGFLPECVMRYGMRKLIAERLDQEQSSGLKRQRMIIEKYRESPLAIHTKEANEQHYELPPAFFEKALGPRKKYSCCHWPVAVNTLAEAEEASLQLVAERAMIKDGMTILELGCGWGSFTLWAGQHFPHSKIVAVSNSNPQRLYITDQAAKLGLSNVEVRTADINVFDPVMQFDRIVSIEMMEHVRNHSKLFERISRWLRPEGRLFVHVFSHRDLTYPFEIEGSKDWMARYFFTGGIMPSHDLFKSYNQHIVVEEDWIVNGTHYAKTSDAWLSNMHAHKQVIMGILAECYGAENARVWFNRWRMFFMACSELFGYRNGEEWGVSHYRFKKA